MGKAKRKTCSSDVGDGIRKSTRSVSLVGSAEPLPDQLQFLLLAPMNTSPTVKYRINLHYQEQRSRYYAEDLGNGILLKMVEIPGGTFLMGSPTDEARRSEWESPQHEVTLRDFFVGMYSITQAQWQAIASLEPVNQELDLAPSCFKGADHPVETVSWHDAVEFCARLSVTTQRDYCLPTEAEWEYACRAGTTTPFHFGEVITTDLANYDGTDKKHGAYGRSSKGISRGETTPVGNFPANAFGLYDMHGNVREWCADYWHKSYATKPEELKQNGNIPWQSDNENANRSLRGGSWFNNPRYCRSAFRDSYHPPDGRGDGFGFRVVCRGQKRTSSIPTSYPATDNLSNEKEIDCTKLQDLLAAGEWREADEETWKVMVEATGSNRRGYLYSGDIGRVSSANLRKIDHLWVQYSRGRFGFSAQKRIWNEVNQDWEQFTERVGWRESTSNLKKYDVLTFSLNAPVGHLPFQFGTPDSCWVWGCLGMGSTMDYLLSRQEL